MEMLAFQEANNRRNLIGLVLSLNWLCDKSPFSILLLACECLQAEQAPQAPRFHDIVGQSG